MIVVCLMSLTGCTSFQTSMIGRGNDGEFSGNCTKLRGKGIPLKLKVPSHLEVRIVETIFIDPDTGKVLSTGKRILDVEQEVQYTDQMFFVDIARPIAGSVTADGQNQGFKIDSEGYLTSLSAEIKDTTINDISGILTGDPLKGLLTSAGVKGGKGLATQTRTIAVQRFDITECDWHHQMNDWVASIVEHCTIKCEGGDCSTCAPNGQGSMIPIIDGKVVDEAPAKILVK